ncbi:hypothetical protein ACHAXS_004531 [Conticribra weissflogii]
MIRPRNTPQGRSLFFLGNFLASFLFIYNSNNSHYKKCFTDGINSSFNPKSRVASSTPLPPLHRQIFPPSLHPSIPILLLSSNSSQYTWTGDHFIPPNSVPTSHPRQFHAYFSRRNTLVIGDSLGRRAYAHLYAVMTGGDWDDLKTKDLTDYGILSFDKLPERKGVGGCDFSRDLVIGGHRGVDCRFIRPWNDTAPSMPSAEGMRGKRRERDDDRNRKGATPPGRFDFLGLQCLKNIVEVLDPKRMQSRTIRKPFDKLHYYDMIIVSMGIWDAVMGDMCDWPFEEGMKDDDGDRLNNGTEENEDAAVAASSSSSSSDKLMDSLKLDTYLIMLAQISNPKLRIVIRTPGFDSEKLGNPMMWQINHRIMELFGRDLQEDEKGDYRYYYKSNANNVTVVDFGSVIAKRSFGEDRINGDTTRHYGLEGRLLFGQQLLHELLAAEIRESLMIRR